jgi:hypothetical protein
LAPWDYIPNEKHIQELREFIKKYYKKEIYLNVFNKAVEENKIFVIFLVIKSIIFIEVKILFLLIKFI